MGVSEKRSGMNYRRLLGATISAFVLMGAHGVAAETLESALARAYGNNPDLNAQRAGVRVRDEDVARAKSGYRPQINATADVSRDYRRSGGTSRVATSRSIGLDVSQTIFNGFRTENSVRQAESGVLSARETLNTNEQDILLNSATAYMNVLRDTAILDLQRNNVEVIDEQLRQTRDRFNVGEVTRTDVAQAEARLAAGRSQQSQAEANLRTSIAQYRQFVGVEPRQLAPGRPLDRLLPRSVDAALQVALNAHPAIKAAQHLVDAAELQVKIEEGALAPQLGVNGSVSQSYGGLAGAGGAGGGGGNDGVFAASVGARLTVPIYEGGLAAASTRQAKETAGQRRLDADWVRDQIRAAVVSSWGLLEASRAQILAAQSQIDAAETALSGVREEARVGQRTTLDVLNAQQELLNARVNLIQAQRDRVVASYQVVQAMGRLNSRALGLAVNHYSPRIHYEQVKDLWGGLTTPDGR